MPCGWRDAEQNWSWGEDPQQPGAKGDSRAAPLCCRFPSRTLSSGSRRSLSQTSLSQSLFSYQVLISVVIISSPPPSPRILQIATFVLEIPLLSSFRPEIWKDAGVRQGQMLHAPRTHELQHRNILWQRNRSWDSSWATSTSVSLLCKLRSL